jgi:hypothetical protein
MESFLSANGVSILNKLISDRIYRGKESSSSSSSFHLSDSDISVLHETMNCYKVIMNNSIGMEGCLSAPSTIECIAKCLLFDHHKSLSLQALEILSVLTELILFKKLS